MCKNVDQTAIDRTTSGYDTIARVVFFLHAEVGAAMFNEHVHLFETAFVQQHGYTLTGCIFTFFVLLGNSLFATALTRYSATVDKLFDFL